MKSVIEIYLDEVKKYPLLTQEDEIRLSKIIQGDYSVQEKEKAIEEMVNANLRIVVSYAIKLYHPCKTISLMDCIQEGNKTLWKSAKSFDYDKCPVRFYSYASLGIERAIRRALGTDRLIRIPRDFFKVYYMVKEMEDKYGSELTNDIIKRELNISDERLKLILTAMEKTVVVNDVRLEEVSGSYNSRQDHEELREYLEKSISKLPEKSKIAIKKIFFDQRSFREASKELNISCQAINHMTLRGLAYLRNQIIQDKVEFSGIPNEWVRVIRGEISPVYKKNKKWKEPIAELP
ncbi:MAG: sigma-70 family RNA polymerase sigma factor [Synergistaceae bacterium]